MKQFNFTPAENPDLQFQRALSLHQSGNVIDAIAIYRRLLPGLQTHPHLLYLLGTAEVQRGNLFEGANLLQRSLQLAPDNVDAWNNRGVALKELHLFDEALASFDRAIQLRPDYADAYNNRGNALRGLKRSDEALANFDRAVQIRPDHADAYNNRGNVLSDLGRMDDALASYDRAIELRPGHADAHGNRGNALRNLGRLNDALTSYERAIQLAPGNANFYFNIGGALLELGRPAAALLNYERAIERNPGHAEAHWCKSFVKLLTGDFTEGWELFEWRWKGTSQKNWRRSFSQPLWLGEEPVAGKTLFIYCEAGLGDAIQFCRYLPLVERMGARVVFEVPRALLSLFSNQADGTVVVEAGAALPPFDLQCPIMSLPLALRTTLATIPAEVPYIRCDAQKSAYWRERLAPWRNRRVGLVWSGGHRPDQPELWAVNDRRNIALRCLEPLNVPGVDFFSLQKGDDAVAQLRELEAARWQGPALADFTSDLLDFSDTAAFIDNLDLVISVDTSTAHLAGAMGKPVWILNRFDTCWRWLLDRSDSPWYPSVTLLRQPARGDWTSVVADARQRLAART